MSAGTTVVTSLPPGTVCCLLCRGMVTYRNQDNTRFVNHMQYEHGAYFDMEFLLAACLMDEEERKAVRNVMELKYKSQMDKKEAGPSVPVLSSADSTATTEKPANLASSAPVGQVQVPVVKQDVPVARPAAPPGPDPQQVKLEVPDEVRVLPEQWDIPQQENLPSHTCGMCDKTFLLKKQLVTHQKKMNHFEPSETGSNNEFSCKLCKYVGTKEKDLKMHVYRKHKPGNSSPSPALSPAPSPVPPIPAVTSSKSASPTPLPSPAVPPGPSPSPQQGVLMSTLAKSWAKSKTSKVKEEPTDTSLQEASEAESASMDTTGEDDSIDPDVPGDVSMDEASDTSSTVEDTTFVSIDSAESSLDTPPAEPAVPNEVDISKSKYFKANPQTVGQLKSGEEDQFNVVDEKMPDGWKVKEVVHEFKSGRKERKRNYLTPDLKVLKTGLAVLEYMRLSGKYTAKQIMDYAKYMAVPVNRLEKYMELYL